MRSPLAPASATVVTLNGLAAEPEPVTAVWLTGVYAVYAPMLDVDVESCAGKFGANNVAPTTRNVPQSPGLTADGKSSRRASPACATWQLSSSPSATLVSGPADAISRNGTAAPAGAAHESNAATA